MMKLYKLMFFNLMALGTMISISSYSWMGMWMGLEINLLSIIPLLNSSKNMLKSESSLKYFISQALASLIMLFSIITMLSTTEFITIQVNSSLILILNSSLLTKMGAAPFHFWFPEVMEGQNWNLCLIILTWQKIAPMILLMNNTININFMTFTILASLIVSALMAFNQTSLRKILTFSSINHLAWLNTSILISFSFWLIYFIIYCITTLNIIIMFKMTNSFYLKQLINALNKNKLFKLTLLLNFFSLSGIPPFIGFLPKWLVINWLTLKNFYWLNFILIIMTLVMIFIYMQIIFSSLLLNFNENLNSINFNHFTLIFINILTLLSMIFCTLIFNFI
uniref:NADH-ubiquinone oxidoreductase chain 2 n=1 Tax=Tenebrionoidea sp. 5 KM-2017 TaxID=2219483 RepID=A0A346RG52_9CUCU|nr:NADH dehydrogenase subunit 2 [Tenebrionoidea sp. 5 KM-2017]